MQGVCHWQLCCRFSCLCRHLTAIFYFSFYFLLVRSTVVNSAGWRYERHKIRCKDAVMMQLCCRWCNSGVLKTFTAGGFSCPLLPLPMQFAAQLLRIVGKNVCFSNCLKSLELQFCCWLTTWENLFSRFSDSHGRPSWTWWCDVTWWCVWVYVVGRYIYIYI